LTVACDSHSAASTRLKVDMLRINFPAVRCFGGAGSEEVDNQDE
jgi:hypothetical protein